MQARYASLARCFTQALGVVALMLPSGARAQQVDPLFGGDDGRQLLLEGQQDIQPWQEYDKKIRSAEHVGSLSYGLMGDQINGYDQSTSFRHVDIDIPGSNGLAVTLARRLVVRPIPAVGMPPQRYAGAGDWDIDVPYISGVFDSAYGWNTGAAGSTGRCSTLFYPKSLPPSRIEEIWSGYTVNIPGGRARSLLGAPASQFVKPDAAVRLWTTSSMDTLSCTPMLSGYAGEGFILETTDGTKYYFDVGTTRTAGTIRSATKSRARVEVYLLASRIEDRFGNRVSYTYNANGHPTSIVGSDGRRITLTYNGNQLVSGSAHGKTWTYGYSGALLDRVTLPDATSWRFTHLSDMRIAYERWTEDPGAGCSVLPPLTAKDYALKIQHPSGAWGTFRFEHKRNFRTGIPSTFCQAESANGIVTHYLGVPFHFDTLSLASKTIEGVGVAAPMSWRYVDDGGSSDGLWSGTVPPCLSCPASKSVAILQPNGSTTVEKYGIVYAMNEGKLLATTVTDSSGVRRTEVLSYVSDAEMEGQPFPDQYGALWGGNDVSAAKIRPVRSTIVTQDGASFQNVVETFDSRGRPTRVRRSSKPGP